MNGISFAIDPGTFYLSGKGVLSPVEYQLDGLAGSTGAHVLSGAGTDSIVQSSITVSRLGDALVSSARGSTIQVTYHGYPSAAQAAFDYAAKLWSTILISTVPITIDAYWQPLPGNTLGSAGPNNLIRWPSAPAGVLSNTWYTIALANQILGGDLDPSEADMTSTLNSDRSDWYFGTDGKTPAGKIDFVSVALHEILHGLGNIGIVNYNTSNGQGGWGLEGYPSIYDRYVKNGFGQSILNTSLFPNPSLALGNQLTSNNLFFAGPNAVAMNNGAWPKLYAPSTWQQGSSYAHLDESTYPRGNPNSLDTPFISYGESQHTVGQIILGILKDEGWKLTLPRSNRDFNSDGQADILMVNSAQGWSGIWTMSGTTPMGWASLPYASGGKPVGAGDFNRDGQADILMANPAQGWSGIWTMSGTTPVGWASLPYASGAMPAGAGDFNGDGQTDILMANPAQGWSGIWTMSGTSPVGWASLPYAAGALPV